LTNDVLVALIDEAAGSPFFLIELCRQQIDGMKRPASTTWRHGSPTEDRGQSRKWRPAMEKIGIDVHKVATQVCILTDKGLFEEFRLRTERDSLTKAFGARAPARIVLEAATESEWVAQHLESLGHEVIVADPGFAPMYASRSRKIKTDKRDARALCEACHLGAYRAAHRASAGSRLLRKHLAVRETLVQTRSRIISLC
jgi:transposase